MSKYIQFERNFVEKFLVDLYVDDTTWGTKSIEGGKEFYVKASKKKKKKKMNEKKKKKKKNIKRKKKKKKKKMNDD